MKAAGRPSPAPSATTRVVLLALASRLLVAAAILLAGAAFPDLDSSALLGAALPCATAAADSSAELAETAAAAGDAPPSRLPLRPIWDAVYFSRIARCGYESDKSNAFFPLVPALMHGAAAALGAPELCPAVRVPRPWLALCEAGIVCFSAIRQPTSPSLPCCCSPSLPPCLQPRCRPRCAPPCRPTPSTCWPLLF